MLSSEKELQFGDRDRSFFVEIDRSNHVQRAIEHQYRSGMIHGVVVVADRHLLVVNAIDLRELSELCLGAGQADDALVVWFKIGSHLGDIVALGIDADEYGRQSVTFCPEFLEPASHVAKCRRADDRAGGKSEEYQCRAPAQVNIGEGPATMIGHRERSSLRDDRFVFACWGAERPVLYEPTHTRGDNEECRDADTCPGEKAEEAEILHRFSS